MRYRVEGRKWANIVLIALIAIVLLSNIFANQLSLLLYLRPDYTFQNQTEIHFISVGQGDAIGIKFDNGKTMLIDSGVVEYEKTLGYYLDNILLGKDKTIDYLLLTHIDADHSGNMLYILNNYTVKKFYRPKVLSKVENPLSINSSTRFDNIISTAIAQGIELEFNVAGLSLTEGNTTLTWLSPLYPDSVSESNDFSPAIRLDYNGHSAMFTGDISDDVEGELMDAYSEDMLDVDILKLAHHGSAYSNSYDFLSATSPEYACVSVGKNTYGHPANKALNRILEYDENNGTNLFENLYSTRDDGNVIFTLKNDINVKTIANINSYSFLNYIWLSLIAVVFLLYYLARPYYEVYKKNWRFIKQNREFEKIQKEKGN